MILTYLDRGVVYPQSDLCASCSTRICLGDSDFWAPQLQKDVTSSAGRIKNEQKCKKTWGVFWLGEN